MDRRKYWSMFEPFKEDIQRLINDGYCGKQIYDILFRGKEGYSYPSLINYIRNHRIYGDLPEDKFEKIPKCSECESLKSITRCVKDRNDILMCQETYKEVNRYGITNCPTWCPKKQKILEEGMKIGNR